MKSKIKYSLSALFLFVSLTVYSQVPEVSGVACVECGGMNGNHKTWCSSYNRPEKSSSTSSGSSLNFQQQITLNIFSNLLNSVVNSSNKSAQQKEQELAKQKQNEAIRLQQLAILLAKQKRINDSIAQLKYEKMMQSYKRLNDSNGVQFKPITTSNLQFKSLDSGGAPMTMEERERQNLKKRGIGITWDYTAWAEVPTNSYKMEEPPVPEASGPDKCLDDAINKIETFEGGRVAALAGRYMVGIKNNTLSYLKDATDAAVSGKISRMEETGQLDLRKLSSNALYETGVKTIKANYENLKDNVMEGLKGKTFEIMQTKAKSISPNYKLISEQLPKDWNEVALDVIF